MISRWCGLDYAVLVDAGGVAEGVGPDDGLIGLDGEPVMSLTRRLVRVDLPRVDVGRHTQGVAAGLYGHDDLFEGGVARALTEAVDAALYLSSAFYDAACCSARRFPGRCGRWTLMMALSMFGTFP